MERVSLLSQVPLFTSSPPGCLDALTSNLRMRVYRRGDIIFHKDDPGSTLHIIEDGQVKIVTSSPEGEEVILAILTDSDFFGELSLLDGRPRSASAIAMQDTRTLTLGRDDFMHTVEKYPEFVNGIFAALCDRLRRTDFLVEDAVFLDLQARLSKRLLEMCERHGIETDGGMLIDLRLTQQDLANAVGATRVAVNKILGTYQDMGILVIRKHRITILRPEKLRDRMY